MARQSSPSQSRQPAAFKDCLARIDRADVHLRALDRLIERFIKGGAYRVVAHIDPKIGESGMFMIRPSGQDPREIVLTGKVMKPLPVRRAGLLISDAVHNLRAALDSIIWLLSITHTPLPTPEPKPWRHVRWPTVLDQRNWSSACGEAIRYVDPSVWTTIEGFQPFVRRKRWPAHDEFAVLDELWRISKHRYLPLTQLWVGPIEEVLSSWRETVTREMDELGITQQMKAAGLPPFPPEGGEHSYTILRRRPPGPFKDGAVLGRVRQVGTFHIPDPEMHVDPKFAVDIAFEKGPPAYGGSVQGTLWRIRDEVRRAVEALRPSP